MWTLTHRFYHNLCGQLKLIGLVAMTLGVILIVYSFQLTERVMVDGQSTTRSGAEGNFFFAVGATIIGLGILTVVCGAGLKHYASWAWYLFISGLLPATLVASLVAIAFSLLKFQDIRDLLLVFLSLGVGTSAALLWKLLTRPESQSYFRTAQQAYQELLREAAE